MEKISGICHVTIFEEVLERVEDKGQVINHQKVRGQMDWVK